MNRWDIQKNAMVACEEMRGSVSPALPLCDLKGPVVCPKPRRIGFLASRSPMSLRWSKRSAEGEQSDAKGGAELLDLILSNECQSEEEVAPSPPFYRGSPPTRVSNPIVQDVNFGNERKLSPFSTLQFLASSSSTGSPSPASPSHKGGCAARVQFGLQPAMVRVEGFNCLGRDRQNSGSITAVA